MDMVPCVRVVIRTTRKEILPEPITRVARDGRGSGVVEPMVRFRICGETGGMRKNHPNRDRLIREHWVPQGKGKINVDIIIKLTESLVVELHKRGTRDGFGDRGDHVDGLIGRPFIGIQIGETVSSAPKDCGVVDDAGGHAWVMTDFQQNRDETIEGNLIEGGMICCPLLPRGRGNGMY